MRSIVFNGADVLVTQSGKQAITFAYANLMSLVFRLC